MKPPTLVSLEDASKIPGNVSPEVKQAAASWLNLFFSRNADTPAFADSVGKRLKLTEVSINPKADEPGKTECKVVCEITVSSDMLNGLGSLHGGCSAYLIDDCSSLPLAAYSLVTGGTGSPGVSQSLNVVYHAPALLGDKLRIVSTTIAVGSRIMSARCEIWNDTHHRLVSSGVHIKMEPSSKL
ncbi:hypothetical protein GLOTRDRAFT_54445 [Gloeophyllum trabeum ATCC 11539]|uniref:Thioesterase domain-containing protein n=1 Tax=Gloeophyllum trabeum (strain ATCC 11539 / FP-39264 / Madison 617) TaxID=670483 RepID=S7QG77_GLOTA|nr:uncharacterized protein GLOTRDRAFT_54445 [Gloeophyllum trabeum ATCC 11539]EPQ58891.1 hypothetical protein GLOTRDRAFT_54445 [Gloeophyllum trabeum ATCC 11539]